MNPAALLFAINAIASLARAQAGSDVPTMTLDEALEYAREHQPHIRVARARLEARKREASISRAQWLPTLGAVAEGFEATANNTTASYVGARRVALPRIGGTTVTSSGDVRPFPSTLAAVGVDQEVFEFGRIAAQAAAADALVEVEALRTETESLDTSFNVEEAYFAVFAAKAVVKASEDAYERARAHRDLAKAGVDSGLRSPIELTRAESDLAKLDTGRFRARGGLAIAQGVLAAAVGLTDAALDVAGAPPSAAETPSLKDAIAQARANDPRLLAAFALLRAEEARTKAIAAELRPDLSLTSTFSGRAGGGAPSGNGALAEGGGVIPNVPNWDVGLTLSVPLFDGVVNARERASRAVEQVRREEVDAASQDEIAAVRRAYVAVEIARGVLPGLARAVDAAHANDDQAEARFRAGLGTGVELADAEALRTDAEIQLALGQFELARARSALGRAIAEGR
jgi:outer membrane protein